MTSSYKDIMADRSARLPPKSAAQQEVFEKAYDIALQVIDLVESTASRRRSSPRAAASTKATSAALSAAPRVRRPGRCSASPRPSTPTCASSPGRRSRSHHYGVVAFAPWSCPALLPRPRILHQFAERRGVEPLGAAHLPAASPRWSMTIALAASPSFPAL